MYLNYLFVSSSADHLFGQFGSGDSSVLRVPDLWLKGYEFESPAEVVGEFSSHGLRVSLLC